MPVSAQGDPALMPVDPDAAGCSAERLLRINDLVGRYVDSGRLAGAVTCLERRGHLAHFEAVGWQDRETRTPMARDSIFRIYSMTKPITSVALMMLYEESRFNLTDPVAQYLPAFAEARVWGVDGALEPAVRPITIQDLLRHTAGLSYGGDADSRSPVDKLYDEADLFDSRITNAEMTRRIAGLPLRFHPGTRWHYSVATDVVGHLVEVLADMPLAAFLQQRIFSPLGMVDTAFEIAPAKLGRFCTLYGRTPDSVFGVLDRPDSSDYLPPVALQSGGSGLVSTTGDYLQFARCILNRGELGGTRLLGPRTVALMTVNHVPSALLPIGYEGAEPRFGRGFGLGFSVMLDIAQAGVMGSVGDHGWGGYAETDFWIDPREDLIAIQMTQYLPSETYPIRKEFRTAVYQSILS